MMRRQFVCSLILTMFTLTSSLLAQETGFLPSVSVSQKTRLDWVFALANQSPRQPPAQWVDGYESTEQTYELFAPKVRGKKKPLPLILFISPGNGGTGFAKWKTVCEQEGIIFAGPHNAGNNCPTPQRVQIVMDVLDDVRRKYSVDADRTYIAGFSGGARIACTIAFALPEYFGGVISVCAAGDLRPESWLRQRVSDRLSVAFVTGENDFNRGEVERFRGPMLQEVGVQARTWVVPKLGHGIPNANALDEIQSWLDEGVPRRAALAKKYPASRIKGEPYASREEWASALLAEAKQRIKNSKSIYPGLMQLKGIYTRWPDVPAGKEALELLKDYDSREVRPWDEDDIAEQRRYLIAQARGVDAYASGELPKQYTAQRPDMLKAAVSLWAQVLQDGQDREAVEEAKRRIPVLQELLTDDDADN